MRNPMSRITRLSEYKSNPGSRIHKVREGHWDGDCLRLDVIGEEDIQEKIQAYAPYCDLHYMLHALSIGDNSVCCKRPPVYGDFSGMPDNPVDAINLMRNGKSRFEQLDLEVRKKYNNDWQKWMAEKISGQPQETPQSPESKGSDDA